MPIRSATALAKLRAACLALPDVTERPSHGMPAWFVGGKQFAVFSNDHHGDGRIAMVCAAPEGMQAMLVDANPGAYYVPPYVGRGGWIGVRLDRDLSWPEVTALVESAHRSRALRATAPRAARAAPRSRSARARSRKGHRPSRSAARG